MLRAVEFCNSNEAISYTCATGSLEVVPLGTVGQALVNLIAALRRYLSPGYFASVPKAAAHAAELQGRASTPAQPMPPPEQPGLVWGALGQGFATVWVGSSV